MVDYAERMKEIRASAIRELLALTKKPEIISTAGCSTRISATLMIRQNASTCLSRSSTILSRSSPPSTQPSMSPAPSSSQSSTVSTGWLRTTRNSLTTLYYYSEGRWPWWPSPFSCPGKRQVQIMQQSHNHRIITHLSNILWQLVKNSLTT